MNDFLWAKTWTEQAYQLYFTKIFKTMGWIHIRKPNQLTHQVHMPLQLLWQLYGLISFWYLWRAGILVLFRSFLLSLEKPKLPLLHRRYWIGKLSNNFYYDIFCSILRDIIYSSRNKSFSSAWLENGVDRGSAIVLIYPFSLLFLVL